MLIDKPKGWTSFDVVAKVRGIIKQTGVSKPKVGHAGTLDPQATGLLTILVGSYCKRAGEFSKLDKTYEVEMKLGVTSTTDDEEGEKSATNRPIPDENTIKQAILSFKGEIEQVPPAFSAIKVGGKRAYKLAREGKEVKLEPRKIIVYSLQITDIELPKLKFTAHVSSGTYIRSLVRDIGEKLDVGAYMTELKRTKVGIFDIKNAHKIDALDESKIQATMIE